MKKKGLLLAPLLLVGLLVSGCGTGFSEIKDEAQKAAAITSLNTATQYADDYVDATFTLKVTAAVLTINFKGVIQITGINSQNPVMLVNVEKTNGDKVFTSYYNGNDVNKATYKRTYDFTFLKQNILKAKLEKDPGAIQLPDILIPSSNYNFFEKFNLTPAQIQTVKQKKTGALKTYLVPVSKQQINSSFGDAGEMTSDLPEDATLFFGITTNEANKVVGLAFEAKLKMENTNVTLVFTLNLKRDGAPSIVAPFTASEMEAF